MLSAQIKIVIDHEVNKLLDQTEVAHGKDKYNLKFLCVLLSANGDLLKLFYKLLSTILCTT